MLIVFFRPLFIYHYSLVLFLMSLPTYSADMIIIDTDGGSDDAVAILMMLRHELLDEAKHRVIAITCTYGNSPEENVERNVLRFLAAANRNITVYDGAKKPILGSFESDTYYEIHEYEDTVFDKKMYDLVDRSIPASMALIDFSKRFEVKCFAFLLGHEASTTEPDYAYSMITSTFAFCTVGLTGNLSIVVLGPPTNVAMAISLDPEFVQRVNKFYVMGGSVAGIGNIRPNVEFNFAADPIANFILLNSTKANQIILFPWETVIGTNIPKEWRTIEVASLAKESPYIDFLNKIEENSLKIYEKTYIVPDGLMVAVVLQSDLVTKSIKTNVEAVYDGSGRGSLLVDYNKSTGRLENVEIVQSIDVKMFQQLFIDTLTCQKITCLADAIMKQPNLQTFT